jgi:hypothetical protein
MSQILRPTWDLLGRLIQSCQRELLICSPWLPTSGLQKLRAALTESLKTKPLHSVQFWSRLSDPNTDSGLLLQFAEELNRAKVQVQLKDSPILHAKIYLADRSVAIFGSCNLSSSGFVENLEIAALLSEPNELRQICAVIDSLEKEMQNVDLNDLAYYVEHQRPTMLQQQTPPPPITLTPIWRQKGMDTVLERKQTAAISDDPRIARIPDATTFNPMEIYHRGLELLDAHQDHISRLDLRVFIGLKVKVVIYPANSNGWVDACWARGQMPFRELEGKIIGEHKPMRAMQTFTRSTITGEEKMTWRFLPKRARKKDYVLANFPVKVNILEGRRIHYVSSIQNV